MCYCPKSPKRGCASGRSDSQARGLESCAPTNQRSHTSRQLSRLYDAQKGPDVEFVAGSINLDGYQAPLTGQEQRQDEIDLRSEHLAGRLADTAEGSVAGCAMSPSLLRSAASVNGSFEVAYFAFASSINPTETETRFRFAAGYQSGDPINVVARFPELTIDETFATPDKFPCTWTVPGGLHHTTGSSAYASPQLIGSEHCGSQHRSSHHSGPDFFSSEHSTTYSHSDSNDPRCCVCQQSPVSRSVHGAVGCRRH